MLDISLGSNLSTTVSFNAVSGTLIKSCSESKITRFHMKSQYAKGFFNTEQPYVDTQDTRKKVILLQVMLCGDSEFLVEFLEKKDEKEN